jgi:stage II sporulation protein AA (anti-sigma F factor antagonist)
MSQSEDATRSETTGSDDAPLRVSTSLHDGVVVVSARGELDISTVPALWRAVEPFTFGDAVALDLRQVTFIDSTSMNVLTALHQRLGGSDALTLVLLPGSQVERALTLTKMLPYFRAVQLPDEAAAEAVAAAVKATAGGTQRGA